jgi:hypothetical protein
MLEPARTYRKRKLAVDTDVDGWWHMKCPECGMPIVSKINPLGINHNFEIVTTCRNKKCPLHKDENLYVLDFYDLSLDT